MGKLTNKSLDLTKLNIEKLKELFPNVITEGKIDFDVLRTVLGDEVDDSKEKYQFTWKGKSAAIKLAQTPSSTTLRPDKESSKNWDSTENLYIEGDNLEVLKQLQKTYYGKIKMIYIDPPYNTGGDFIYPDNYKDSIDNYLNLTNQKTTSNPETSGSYHTKWLNMIYPRLSLAKNLLKKEGVIAISIDDNELYNLKKVCDEIFGESNFINTIAIKMSTPSGVKLSHRDKTILKVKEYLVIYAKDKNNLTINPQYLSKNKWDDYYEWYVDKNGDNPQEWKVYRLKDYLLSQGINNTDVNNPLFKKFYFENADKIWQRGRNTSIPKDILEKSKNNWNTVFEYGDENGEKQYCYKGRRMAFLKNVIKECIDSDGKLIRDTGTLICDFWDNISTAALFAEGGIEFPNGKKPQLLLNTVLRMFTDSNDTILDFFSGSASTAEAIMRLNMYEDRKNKYIMVQFPERIEGKYLNICKLGQERIRLSGEKILEESHTFSNEKNLLTLEDGKLKLDIGFKVFKLDSTNIQPWDNEIEMNENNLFTLSDVFKEGRSKEDILYEIMLKYGVFDMPATEVEVNGKTMYRVGKRYMIVCLEDEITFDDVKAIVELRPRTVVFKESGFENDNDKINAEYNLEKAGVEDIKCI